MNLTDPTVITFAIYLLGMLLIGWLNPQLFLSFVNVLDKGFHFSTLTRSKFTALIRLQ